MTKPPCHSGCATLHAMAATAHDYFQHGANDLGPIPVAGGPQTAERPALATVTAQ